jgi:hypothetical protein
MSWSLILTFSQGQAKAIHSLSGFESKEAADFAGAQWKESLREVEKQNAHYVSVSMFMG